MTRRLILEPELFCTPILKNKLFCFSGFDNESGQRAKLINGLLGTEVC